MTRLNDDELKTLGRMAQLLPSYLRIVCRSRVDYTPLEIIDRIRGEAMDTLKTWAGFNLYNFASLHYRVLDEFTPRQALIIIESLRRDDFMKVCPFVRSERKTSCFICGLVREFMGVMEYGDTPSRISTPTGESSNSREKALKTIAPTEDRGKKSHVKRVVIGL